MPTWLDISAILWALGLAILISVIGGAVLGVILAARDSDDIDDADTYNLKFDAHPGAWQTIMALSVVSCLAGGALLAKLTTGSPMMNSAVLAGAALALHLIMRDAAMPKWLFVSSIIVMPSAVLLGTYIVTT